MDSNTQCCIDGFTSYHLIIKVAASAIVIRPGGKCSALEPKQISITPCSNEVMNHPHPVRTQQLMFWKCVIQHSQTKEKYCILPNNHCFSSNNTMPRYLVLSDGDILFYVELFYKLCEVLYSLR
eukprot:scpid5473/ scgid25526/ 